jgi:mRNA interferase HigB
MRVISEKPLRDFWEDHPDAETPLRHWLTAVKAAKWKTFSELRATFRSADGYKDLTIFNIGGNKYRLIVAINYKTQIVYVHYVLTHKDYDSDEWKEK